VSDKAGLSRDRPQRAERDDEDIVQAVARLIAAVGRRASAADPDSAHWLRYLAGELDDAFAAAVAGWRLSGFSDAQIGRELGVTKQAVQQRWPR
jgi:DNA-directed RNA polymerase specialized sigma24 family protein